MGGEKVGWGKKKDREQTCESERDGETQRESM